MNVYYGDSFETHEHKSDKRKQRSVKRVARLQRYVRQGNFLDIGCNVGYTVQAAHLRGFKATGIGDSKGALGL